MTPADAEQVEQQYRGMDVKLKTLMTKFGLVASLVFSLGFVLTYSSITFAAKGDPYEGVNRKVFALNEFLDKWLLKPVAKGYRWITPGFVDDGVSNVFDNLGEVRNLVNGGLQGDLNHAGTSTGRLLVNSTVGLAGLFDVATGWGLEERKEDFGQTLAVWGVGDGPYIMLPFIGGNNLRDTFSRFPDTYMSPVTYVDDVPLRNSLRGLDLVDTRADLIDAEALISGDRYSFLRDITSQRRESSIKNGVVEDDFEDSF